MKKSRFTEEQMVKMLREADGTSIAADRFWNRAVIIVSAVSIMTIHPGVPLKALSRSPTSHCFAFPDINFSEIFLNGQII